MKFSRHPATVIATVALLIALGGGTVAYASGMINGSSIKNHSIPANKLTAAAVKSLQNGPLGYAHINPDGSFDAAHSWNVKASNVVEPSTGFFCFNGLKFKPKNVQVTGDYYGPGNGNIPIYTVQLPATSGTCGTAKQVMVFTGLVTPGGFTAGTNLGFYVTFN